MNIIIFLIRKRIKAYFSIRNYKMILSDGLLGLCILLYALGAAYLYDYSIGNPQKLPFRPSSILTGIKIFLLAAPIFLKFFPSISLNQPVIGTQYPVGRVKSAYIDLLAIQLFKTINLILFLSIIIFFLTIQDSSYELMWSFFLSFLLGFLLAQNIINAISWNKYLYLALMISLLIIVYLNMDGHFLFGDRKNFTSNLYLSIFSIVLLVTYFLFYDKRGGQSVVYPSFKFMGRDRYIYKFSMVKALLRSKTYRNVLLIAMLLKIGFLVLFFSEGGKTLSILFNKLPFVILLISPLILFTYIYNNIWGYFYNIEVNHIIINSRLESQINSFLNLLVPTLFLDLAITFILLFSFHLFELKILLFYIFFSLFCIPFSIISSFNKYFFVPAALNFNQFRGKTSIVFSFIIIIPAFICGFVYQSDLFFYLFLFSLCIIFILSSLYIKTHYSNLLSNLRYRIFN